MGGDIKKYTVEAGTYSTTFFYSQTDFLIVALFTLWNIKILDSDRVAWKRLTVRKAS